MLRTALGADIAGFLLSAQIHGLGIDHDERLPDFIAAVSLDEANRAARRLLDPLRACIVVAGPYQKPDVAVA